MKTKLLPVFLAASVLAACGSDPERTQPAGDIPPPPTPARDAPSGDTGVFGWFGAGGSSGGAVSAEERKGVAVNAYLWRASLDSLSFMPMDQIDPFSGVIKTGWYVPPATPNERFRIFVVILDKRLRAEAIRVTIFKELKTPTGAWEPTAALDPETLTKIENVILDRARALKIQSE